MLIAERTWLPKTPALHNISLLLSICNAGSPGEPPCYCQTERNLQELRCVGLGGPASAPSSGDFPLPPEAVRPWWPRHVVYRPPWGHLRGWHTNSHPATLTELWARGAVPHPL